ncbi:hypothetical protein [Nonomuraea salmonea]|uniref:FXSXX-COOH protein n=1 Tax=Nonomuraea salmonea TaxID=46181 RepID=A0ABV5P1I9_9ACTN
MGDESTGLVDVCEVTLDDLRRLRDPALLRAMQHLAESSRMVAGFQSAI